MRHAYSLKVCLRTDHLRTDSTHALQLQAIINRSRAVIGLGISVHAEHWDPDRQRVRVPRQAEYNRDTNMAIQMAVTKANEIFRTARLSDTELTPSSFKLLFHGGHSRSNFLDFYQAEMIKQRGRHKANTSDNHQYTLDKLTAWRPVLPFYELNEATIREFDDYLRRLKLGINTIHKHHRFTRKFIRLAIKAGHLGKDPYGDFRPPRAKGMRQSLTRDELSRLVTLHASGRLPQQEQSTLNGFLASVYNGGIRFSDLASLTPDNVHGNYLVFIPKKLERFGHRLEVPISPSGRHYLQLHGPLLVPMPCNQVVNRSLKDIAKKADIDKTLTFHLARHTFVSVSLELGMKPDVVKQITGITSWSVISDYIHVNRDRMTEAMLEHMPRMAGD